MSRYLTGNRSTQKLITIIEAQPLKPRRKGRKPKSPPTSVVEQKPKEKNNISQSPATRFQGNEGQLCIPSTQPKDGAKKPTTKNNPPPARNQSENKVSSRPLNERFIHLLAMRSYTITELYDRISKEGMKKWERGILPTILKRVASFIDGAYHLQECFRKDVQEDWPYYTEEEKAMLKKKKLPNLTPPGSSDGSSVSGPSPNSTHLGSSQAVTAPDASGLTYKRPSCHQDDYGIMTKRPRISHYKKSEECSKNSTTTNSSDNARTPGSSSGGSGDNEGVASAADYSAYGRNASGAPSSCTPTLPESPKHTKCVDYLTHYTTISNMEQRIRYKAEFNANYDEYQGLHAEAMNVWQRIADLEERLNQVRTSGNQNEFEGMQQQYLMEYSRTKNDPVRVQKERRFYYLHNKLDHIKRLVIDYETLNGIANMVPKGCDDNNSGDIGAEVIR